MFVALQQKHLVIRRYIPRSFRERYFCCCDTTSINARQTKENTKRYTISSTLITRTIIMIWTPELASFLEDAPWPATKEELIDFAERSGAPMQVIDNLQELEEEDVLFESIEDIWPDSINQDDDLYYDEDTEDEGYY